MNVAHDRVALARASLSVREDAAIVPGSAGKEECPSKFTSGWGMMSTCDQATWYSLWKTGGGHDIYSTRTGVGSLGERDSAVKGT